MRVPTHAAFFFSLNYKMSKLLHHDDDDNTYDAKAIEVPQVYSENYRPHKPSPKRGLNASAKKYRPRSACAVPAG